MGRILYCVLWAIVVLCSVEKTSGQVTYNWTVVEGSWQDPANWTPQRITPLSSDQLVFNSGNSVLVWGVPNESIQSLTISNNTSVSLITSGSSKTIGITQTLTVESGARLFVSGAEQNNLQVARTDEPNSAPTFSVQDGGDNTILFKFSKNRNTLFDRPRILGVGSSTMYGSGATTGFKLHERLKAWVQANIPGGEFYHISNNGFYSNHFLPDGESPESRWSKNIQAVLDMEPNIVVLSLPTNDIAFLSNAQFMANLQHLDEICKSRNIHLFVTTTQPRNDYNVVQQQRLFDTRDLILQQFGSRAIDVFTPLADPYTAQAPARIRDIYNADNIHPNNDGHGVIANLITTAWTNYFTDPDYNQFTIERSTNPTSGFTEFINIVNPSATSYSIARENGELYYYRIRARRTNQEFTEYSPAIALQQPLLGGAVTETIQINFSRQANQQNIPQWNEFIPSGGVADVGEEITNLITTGGQQTNVGVRVVGAFPSTSNSGGRPGTFPDNVIRTSWVWGADNSVDKPALLLTGLTPNTLYNVKCLFSNLATADYRFVGVDSQGKVKAISANHPVTGSNDSNTANLLGLSSSSSGEIELRFRALPTAGLGYLNAMILQKVSTTSQGVAVNISLGNDATADIGGTVKMVMGTFSATNSTVTLHSSASPLQKGSGNFSLGTGTTLIVGKTPPSTGPAIQFPNNLFAGNPSISTLVMQHPNGVSLGNQPITINNSLQLISGNITTNTAGRLSIKSTALPVVESASSKISGFVELQQFNAGTAEINFMGLRVLSGTDNLGNVTIQRVTGSSGINMVNGYQGIAATWNISAQTQPVSGRQVILSWFQEFDNGNNTANRFQVYRSEGGNVWQPIGSLAGLASVTADTRTTASVTTTQFSSWTVSDETQPLPVVWDDVSAFAENGKINVHWETLSEFNADYYDVEKLDDQRTFQKIGQVKVAGTTNKKSFYDFKDSFPFAGNNYYRLKQVDLDGAYAYSKVVSAFFKSDENFAFEIFPNPTEDMITVRSYSADAQNGQLFFVDSFGRKVESCEWKSNVPLSLNEMHLTSGVYTVLIVSPAGQTTVTLIFRK